MNIFRKIIVDDIKAERSLGNPLRDEAARDRRMNIMATFTDGKGFRKPRLNDKRGVSAGEKRRRARLAAKEGRANG